VPSYAKNKNQASDSLVSPRYIGEFDEAARCTSRLSAEENARWAAERAQALRDLHRRGALAALPLPRKPRRSSPIRRVKLAAA
jgi:hypothetical protein